MRGTVRLSVLSDGATLREPAEAASLSRLLTPLRDIGLKRPPNRRFRNAIHFGKFRHRLTLA
jgi:hypothetical protein